jgi:hypothetical protein
MDSFETVATDGVCITKQILEPGKEGKVILTMFAENRFLIRVLLVLILVYLF